MPVALSCLACGSETVNAAAAADRDRAVDSGDVLFRTSHILCLI
jgi:hypothetical protein